MSSLFEYFEALERLKESKPLRISAPYSINKDTVALEAGRKRGSIKKSREVNSLLIKEINKAREMYELSKTESPIHKLRNQLANSKKKSDEWRKKYEEAIGRELSLLKQLRSLQKELIKARKTKK